MSPMQTLWSLSMVLLLVSVGPVVAQKGAYTFPYYPLEVGQRWTYLAKDLRAPDAKTPPTRRVDVEVDRKEIYTDRKLKEGKEVVTEYTGFLLKSTSGG